MMDTEDMKLFLPKYLSEQSYRELISQLKDFPGNLDGRFYTKYLEHDVLFQGDGIESLPIVNIEKMERKDVPCIVLSNTCDIDPSNNRLFPSRVLYSPIVSFSSYSDLLSKHGISQERIEAHLKEIRTQKLTNTLYLPQYGDTIGESLVFLDNITNCKNSAVDRNTLNSTRIFSLSNYGFYLLLFKISIHFSRIMEKVDRA